MSSVRRRIDDLGRVCIPIEFRRILNLKVNDYIEVDIKDNKFIALTPVEETSLSFRLKEKIDKFDNLIKESPSNEKLSKTMIEELRELLEK